MAKLDTPNPAGYRNGRCLFEREYARRKQALKRTVMSYWFKRALESSKDKRSTKEHDAILTALSTYARITSSSGRPVGMRHDYEKAEARAIRQKYQAGDETCIKDMLAYAEGI
jgi:hypothetical protein